VRDSSLTMTVALIVAAGSGERLGADRPKALVELAGRPLLEWSIHALRAVAQIERIVVAMPPGALALPPGVGAAPLAAATAAGAGPPAVTAVAGGAVRSDSVRRALAAAGEADTVLVHDAARPLLTAELAREVIAALERCADADAAIAALPVTDTIKRVAGAESATGGGDVAASGTVAETLDRSRLWAVQTPQVFRRAALERALDVPAEQLAQATDDAWLIERAGGRVIVVRGEEQNLKVTTPLDLRVAELLLRERAGRRADG
jgi:2-C-methyl-D-erythritol 4-phosphate cytidylyltransferase